MPLISDLTLNVAKFDPASISEQCTKLNDSIISKFNATPAWYEVGAQKYREMRYRGETALPAPVLLPQAVDISIASREKGRYIPCRILYPQSRKTEEERKGSKGVVLHFHGGGWVLGDQRSHDGLLQLYADAVDMVTISAGYRVAPEDPFPKGPEDCFDVAEYLVKNAESVYGGPLIFIGGESAGAHLSVLTTFHLLKTHPAFHLSGGLLLHFGCYDLSVAPSSMHYKKNLILNGPVMKHFIDAFLPDIMPEQRKIGAISPLYEDFAPLRGNLPSALFTIGTDDPLVDDTVNMAMKWLIHGGEAILKAYPGGCHGFIGMPPSVLKEAGDALEDTKTFMKDRLAASSA
ncbi:related to lipase 2 [Rhynchosporium secalis]|uniref:Related to lipase 2 n=1 Tax=Rhynchosporium secalis TaxID=38038 RepID=A0A1E1MN06_RHYSE|nr:related to lipase 2 [Rhynchosporium secalis]